MDTNRSSHHNGKNGLNKNFGKLIISFIIIVIILGVSLVLYEAKAQTENSSKGNAIIMHFHPRLNITMDGKPIIIPAQIGINSSLWKDHSLDKYGMQSMNMRMPGMAPLHTMDSSGAITVESSVKRNYTLGEFINIWGIDLNGKEVKITVDGKPVTDFKNYILKEDADDRLDIAVNGRHIPVPAGVGMHSSLWKDHSLDKYGMQSMNMRMPGMAPLHTHDASGIIHVESNDKNRNYTLGQFLDIWGGLDLNGKTVKMTVNGKSVSDFRNHILRDKEQIILDIEK